ncbi:MAG: DNA primase [Nitrososphaeria archaeon]|nr:DNA primase [Nitrososphaeria archaeon]NIN52671.1 DNA primase [Nitrososphaeria archaeon]NIQ33146.1 DNA primase [Nitrososphaeria archaeon]
MKNEEAPTKYLIEFDLDVDGVVEENDVIGAIFGQTEGLLGPIFDLREMQRVGKIGRIVVKALNKTGKTKGTVSIFCGLDMPSTSLLSALVESVNQIGPYKAKIILTRILDYRKEKIQQIRARAQQILDNWKVDTIPETEDIVESLRRYVSPPPVMSIGKEKIAAGPMVRKGDEVILVEGRADVANMLKYGIKNTLAIGGGKIPETIKKFLQNKKVVAFLDGDRGGELNLKKLLQTVKVDYVARAPKGKEVEDLRPQEIFKALESKVPLEQVALTEREELKSYNNLIKDINGTLEALLIDEKDKTVEKVAVSTLVDSLSEIEKDSIKKIIFDGIITQRLLDAAEEKGITLIIGNRKGEIVRRPVKIEILSFGE